MNLIKDGNSEVLDDLSISTQRHFEIMLRRKPHPPQER